MAKALTLKTIFNQRQKRMLGVVVWDFKGQEGNSHEDGKANVWQINVCWATTETMGHRVDSDL